jgi:molybdopterin converting factor small subunit
MTILKIPTPLRAYTSGHAEVSVSGGTVASALDSLIQQYPSIKPHLFNEAGSLRPFVNLFVGQNSIKDLQGLETTVGENDRLLLIPSIAGG